MGIEDNKRARETGKFHMRLAEEELQTHEPSARLHFWKAVATYAINKMDKDAVDRLLLEQQIVKEVDGKVKPYTDKESREFGKMPCPFKKHKDVPVDDVPLSYWFWVDKQPDFRHMLKRYLASARVQQEQRNG